MSTHSSGIAYWLAGVLVALLLSQAAANSAIVTSKNDIGQWDVSLNITHIDIVPGLGSWDDLAFTTLQDPWFSNATDDLDDIDTHYQILIDKASEHTNAKVQKRFRWVYKWVSSAWKLDKKHAVTAGALGALYSTVAGSTDAIIKLGRSAICGKDENGKQRCISWSRGIQAIKKSIALDIIWSAQQNFGQDAVSGEEYAAVFDESTKGRKRSSHNVCISNRPNGCTGP